MRGSQRHTVIFAARCCSGSRASNRRDGLFLVEGLDQCRLAPHAGGVNGGAGAERKREANLGLVAIAEEVSWQDAITMRRCRQLGAAEGSLQCLAPASKERVGSRHLESLLERFVALEVCQGYRSPLIRLDPGTGPK